MNYRKKLIEVALPLDDINVASAREKSIRHGHPSTLHLWWARRPLAAARAVIFAQMVDDPSAYVDTLRQDKKLLNKATREQKKRMKVWELAEKEYKFALSAGAEAPEPGPKPALDEILAEIERERLFKIISELVLWGNTTNEEVLERARAEIWQSWRRTCADNVDHPRAKELFDRHKLPAFHDPFAGGGSLPLEAQRLGLEAYASDLNPVAVLINKAMIEIPPKFADRPPVNPEARQDNTLFEREWKGAEGLAEDVRYYGKWMRDEAEKRIGHLYPKVKVTEEMVENPDNPRPVLKQYLGRELTVIAWLWARTVKSPNPAFAHVDVPLASTFMLSTKKGKEAYVEPLIKGDSYRFTVKVGKPENIEKVKRGTKTGDSGSIFFCLMSQTPMPFEYLRNEAKNGRMGTKLMAIIAEGDRGRVYVSPTPEMEAIAQNANPVDIPETDLPAKALGFRVQEYGMAKWRDLFTPRQLVALSTFSNIVLNEHEKIVNDALISDLHNDGIPFSNGGLGAQSYADSVAIYLALLINQVANHSSSLCGWNSANSQMRSVYARHALPMVWDFAESNPFCSSSGSLHNLFTRQIKGFRSLGNGLSAGVFQVDAVTQKLSLGKIVSTDPPYYDNIGYADLSDFFYLWLRRTLKSFLPELFTTITVPKTEELIASTYRQGSRENAENYFLEGMKKAMHCLAKQAHPLFPITIYYAFKQSESEKKEDVARTGWEVFLDAVICSGFTISGTWPMRTEKLGRVIGIDTNALASSIILVCRKSPADAPTTTRRDFINSLKAELPRALAHLQRSNIAPVDLAQAAIGPGMAVYTYYESVLETDGSKVGVREALALINQVLDEVLAEQEGDFDADTRWALSWFEQFGFAESEYGVAETLATAKNTSVTGLVEAGILYAKSGKVRLLKPDELPKDWNPQNEKRLTVWEIVHHLVRALEQGEGAAAELIAKLGVRADSARELTYRLYMICERKKWAQEALAYNSLVQSWPEMVNLAKELEIEEQQSLF